MTNDQKNKEMCKLLGIDTYSCWWCERCQTEKSASQVTFHETCTVCGCSVVWRENCIYDFTIDPVSLLREMRKLPNYNKFAYEVFGESCWASESIPTSFVLDQTGKLLDLTLEWMRRKKG